MVFVSFGLLPMVHWAWVTPAEQRLRYHGLLLLMFALCACHAPRPTHHRVDGVSFVP